MPEGNSPQFDALSVFCKYPEPGKVKTRLGKEIGFDRAAALYGWLLQQNLSRLLHPPPPFSLFLFYDPVVPLVAYRRWLGAYSFVPQEGRDLGERMYQAFDYLFARGFGHVLLVGSDIPRLDQSLIRQAFALLRHHDVVLGPAEDGGYYLIGLRPPPLPSLFHEIPWSTSTVLEQTLERVRQACLSCRLVEKRRDIDTVDDLLAFPELQEFWP
ncbi:MAG: glycosyltransferase [Nitrospinota bacterium]|nr:MAG: glycosyltransferase [Nitrospinota bacterium]